MSPQRIIGAAVLIAGIVLLIFGLNASDSMADQVSETFTGRFTETTTWYIIGGIAAGVLGLLMVAFGGHRSRAAR
jgi:drug/metabolite transporter (DMT)-like permease